MSTNQFSNQDSPRIDPQGQHPQHGHHHNHQHKDQQTNRIQTGEPMKDRGVINQLINPDMHRVDPGMYPQGENPAAAVEGLGIPAGAKLETNLDAPKEHGILRQILNPHGHKVDDVAFGNNATVHRQ